MNKILYITILFLSIVSSDNFAGIHAEKGTATFGFSSNTTIVPHKPSTGLPIEKYRTLHGSLLLKFGTEYLFGKMPDQLFFDEYQGIAQHIKGEDFGLRIHHVVYYGTDYKHKPKEFGALFYIKNQFSVSKKTPITPYIKYTYMRLFQLDDEYRNNELLNENYTVSELDNMEYRTLELVEFGGYYVFQQLIISASLIFPFKDYKGIYNNKGTINFGLGLLLD